MEINVKEILKRQRDFFSLGRTLPVSFRIDMLKKLYLAVKENEEVIFEALRLDLGKSEYESYMCEVGLSLSEISYLIKNTKKFAKPRRVKTPIAQFAAKSYEIRTPYGNTLIMSPWNYPFLLTVTPLATAIAAGNTAIVKPSAYAPNVSALISDMLGKIFPDEYVATVSGGRRENAALLSEKFDFIFFTGSQSVGKEVLRRAAENLTPAVLELGGKSPAIVDETAKIPLAAKRIVFGKLLNAGQTCVAPDYILCQKSVKDELVREIIREIKAQCGDNPLENSEYGKIINEKHFSRILSLISSEKVVYGGEYNESSLKIAPTVMDNVSFDDAVMGEEIFGPILPIVSFDSFDEVYKILSEREKPLALYLFTEDRKRAREAVRKISFGGGCINDTVIHLATSNLGFGGVGESGMGAYHGKVGFDSFSHTKSIVDKKTFIDLPMRYRPYKSEFSKKLLRRFLK